MHTNADVDITDSFTHEPAKMSNNAIAPQAVVKEELDSDIFMDSDENETVYKPRPQLPQPNVHMRSLASLISKT